MTSPSVTTRAKKDDWGLVFLLLVSVFVNYVDRGNLSIAAPVLGPELSLTPTQLGLLFSAFFWTYSVFQIVSGWLVDRFDVSWVYAAGYLLWSLATLLTGFTGTFATLFAMRLLLGIGESVAYPACSQILVRNFPEHQRGRANALIDVGTKAGPALGTLLGGLLVARYGWRALFIITGLVSMLWLVPWYFRAPHQVAPTAGQRDRGPGLVRILQRRAAWGTSLGMFCYGYAWYFLLSWLPSYLVMERHFGMRTMAVLGSLPYWAVAVSALVCGWLSDRWIARGASVTRVRKTLRGQRTAADGHADAPRGDHSYRLGCNRCVGSSVSRNGAFQLERVGHFADSRRASRGWEMDRYSERHWQSRRRDFPVGHRADCLPHRFLFHGVSSSRSLVGHWSRCLSPDGRQSGAP